jgi:8-amino-7-oxononanoate synthase
MRKSELAATHTPTADGPAYADLFARCSKYTTAREAQAGGWYPYFMAITGSEGTEVVIDGARKIMLGSNNYLGLTHDPRVLEQAERAARQYGSGCTGSRLLNGTLDLHEQLEGELAEYMHKPAALVFSTGYQTNLGIIATLAQRGDAVILDKLDHASIVDGAKLSGAAVFRYRHGDLDGLQRALERASRELPHGGKLVIVDGVFSMEGDVADLPAIIPLCQRYGARLAVDEAHSVGVMGDTGAGVHEHFGVTDACDILIGTFSKSFASIGGFAAGDETVMHYVKHHARALIFSASMPPYALAAVRESLRIIRSEPALRALAWRNRRRLKDGLAALGFDTGTSTTPIVPIVVGDSPRTFAFWKALFDHGVFTNPVIPPAVPEGSSRIRTSVMASHTDAQIDLALERIERAGKQVGLI